MLPRVPSRVDRLADVAVTVGANVQPGQVVAVEADVSSMELARAITTAAYRRGAKFVEVRYWDAVVKRLRLLHAPEETLEYVPSWFGERLLTLGRERCARIVVVPTVPPGALDGVDPQRAGRDQLPFVPEVLQVINDESVNWVLVPGPGEAWARLVHDDVPPDVALERLWTDVERVCRLDEDDPSAAWQSRMDALAAAAGWLNQQRFDAVEFEGPGTKLTVGLFESSLWKSALNETRDGIRHLVNIPSEELFTTPDPARADGVVRSTKPLDLHGTLVRGLEVRFESGRAVQIDADEGAEAIRARCALDDDASRLGEVALVDREGRVGQLDTVFYETLLDENAASHIAFGNAYEAGVADERDRERLNKSKIHVDFMVGGEDVDVTGLTRSGERVPILRGNAWQF